MPIIRRQRPKGYTVISNYIFTQDTISLKAIGLFCYMVSRPDGWNFSERGLASQLKDGKASIASALKELKEKQYIKVETNQRNELGRMIGSAYYLYQIPYSVDRTTLESSVFTGEENRGEFRIEKITNFTMLSNYHLLDGMSLKAMGLLSYILSLPDEWSSFSVDYFQNKFPDGRTVITSALKELQERHYIQIKQTRNNKGLLGKSEYTIYEYPFDLFGEGPVNTKFVTQAITEAESLPCPENPHTDNQDAENLAMVKQAAVKQDTENQPHININTPNNNKININEAIIKSSSSHSTENLKPDRAAMKKMIKERIGYDSIMERNEELDEQMENNEISKEFFDLCYVHPRYLNSLVNAMVDVYCSTDEIKTGVHTVISKHRIIENFEALEYRDIREIVHRLTAKKPQNVRGYIQVIIHNYL